MKTITIEKEQGEDVVVTIVDAAVIPPEPPVEDPFVLVDSAVKGVNGYQHNYQNGVWSDGINVPGWYLGTLSYTATPNAFVSMKFNGTKIEWYTEKGPTHGIVGVSIDGGAETMVDLYAAQFAPMIKVWESETTAAVRTVKLRCTGTKNALSSNVYLITDLFKVFNPVEVPDVPVPPSTDITVQPGQSIKAAVEAASSGKTVRLLQGTYTENLFTVPVGVSLKGAGKDKTIINFTGTHPQQSETAMVNVKSGSRVVGNQEVSGFTIKGGFLCNGGIMLSNRDNVKILDVKVQETTYFGVWMKNTTGSEFANSDLFNSSWASVGWVTGELCVHNITNTIIHHNFFKTTRNDKGYGIKGLWPDGTVTNSKFYNNRFELTHFSLWNNGSAPNIDIELHNTFYNGIEIYENDFSVMGLSLASHRPTKGGRTIVRNNRFVWSSTAHIELVCSNITVGPGNVFTGAPMMTANFQPNGKWTDIIITGNTFTSNGANPSWGGTHLIGANGMDMTITNNVYNNLGGYTFVKHMGPPGNSVVVDTGNTKNQ
jgi:hypothetical protein